MFLLPSFAMAQVVTATDPFNFGTISTLNNSTPRDLIISAVDGQLTYDPSHFLVIIMPTRARIDLSGFPADTDLTITASATSITEPGGQFFDLVDVATNPVNPRTDGSGAETVRFGSTLRTSGDGQIYDNGSFSGSVLITIFY